MKFKQWFIVVIFQYKMTFNGESSQVNDMLGLLSLEQRRKFTQEIEKAAMDRLGEYNCPICHENVGIPVKLTEYVFCTDCGDQSNRIACLHCTRTWLELNKPPVDRKPQIKHIICDKLIDPSRLNAAMCYEVDLSLIDRLDKYEPREVVCKCGFKSSRRDVYTHIKTAKCPLSVYKCPGCQFRGLPSEYILHTHKCSSLDHSRRNYGDYYNPYPGY